MINIYHLYNVYLKKVLLYCNHTTTLQINPFVLLLHYHQIKIFFNYLFSTGLAADFTSGFGSTFLLPPLHPSSTNIIPQNNKAINNKWHKNCQKVQPTGRKNFLFFNCLLDGEQFTNSYSSIYIPQLPNYY